MRKPILFLSLIILLCGLFLFPYSKADPIPPFPYNPHQRSLGDSIEHYFQKARKDSLLVGVSVAVVSQDTVLFQSSMGYRSLNTKDTVNSQTVFRVGSLSKGFTALLAASLVEEDLLSWEEKVKDQIDDFRLKPTGATEKVRLKHLLSHTTGLPYHCYTNLVEDGLSVESIASKFGAVSLLGEPGELYSYQNAAFALSGILLEKAGGKDLESLFRERLFTPLGMKQASTSHQGLLQSGNYAHPHQFQQGAWQVEELNEKYYTAIPAGGINASLSDMILWMQALLGSRPEIISEEARQSVFQARIHTNTRKNRYFQGREVDTDSWYGFGWRIHTFVDTTTGQRDTLYHHGGSVNGFRSEIAIHPGSKVGICVLFNNPSPLARHVIPDLLGLVGQKLEAIRNWQTVQL